MDPQHEERPCSHVPLWSRTTIPVIIPAIELEKPE